MRTKQILEFLLESNTSISSVQILISLLMAFVLGWFLYFIYRKTYRGTLYSKNFNLTLVLITVITATVMLVIGSNLALSLGMVGSLSIIRFRTAVKEPRDIAFLFWAICIGLACGSEMYLAGILGCLAIALVLLIGSLDLYDVASYLLVIRGKPDGIAPDDLEAVLAANSRSFKLRMRNTSELSEEFTYELQLKKGCTPAAVVSAVRKCSGTEVVNLVSYSGEVVG